MYESFCLNIFGLLCRQLLFVELQNIITFDFTLLPVKIEKNDQRSARFLAYSLYPKMYHI